MLKAARRAEHQFIEECDMRFTVQKIGIRAQQKLMKLVIPHVIKYAPPKLLTGPGCVVDLAAEFEPRGISRVLLVTDEGLMGLGLPASLIAALQTKGVECIVYDAVDPNPSKMNVEGAVQCYQKNNCEAIIGFGGGSPMDCAKATAARIANPDKSLEDLRGNLKVNKPVVPLFAVPTTSGTGSETTVGAVITDTEEQLKFAISGNPLVPLAAVLDPELTLGLPPSITAATGMDALTHAVESYIGTIARQTEFEKSEQATKLIFDNLEIVYRDGGNLEGRNNMALASFYAAESFNFGLLGYVHSIAETLGALYGIPHGVANAVILPHVLDFSRDDATVEKRLAQLARVTRLGDSSQPDEALSRIFIDKVRSMNENMSMPTCFEEMREQDVPLIVRRGLDGAHSDYGVPKVMCEADCEALIRKLLPFQ